MKKIICVLCHLLVLGLLPVWGQQPPVNPMTGTPNSPEIDPTTGLPFHPLTKFDLDFPGGTPAELVKAIEKATGKALNAFIPTDDADTILPPLKMNDVTTSKLFAALKLASQQSVDELGGNGFMKEITTSYGFETSDDPVSDGSIWYFRVEKPLALPMVSIESVKFYQLAPYLDRGFNVDDITTAVQTGWKMAGITSPPELNYHKETKILIAFGKPEDLQTIQNVLDTLPATNVTRDEAKYVLQEADKVNLLDNEVNNLNNEVHDLTFQVSYLEQSVASLKKNSGK
jgi:hypothetical protein